MIFPFPISHFTGSQIVQEGLVAYYDANVAESYPGTGTTWYDISGNARHAQDVNGLGFDSVSPKSRIFDGVNDFSQTSFKTSFVENTRVFTFGFALKFNNYLRTEQPIGGCTSTSVRKGHYLSAQVGAINLAIVPTVGTAYLVTKSGFFIDNNWNYYNIVGNGTSIKGYRNGNEVTGFTTPTGALGSGESFADYRIGSYDSGLGVYFHGKIGHYAIYNIALTPAQINQNFNAIRATYSI